VLGVVLLYALARRLVGKRTALLAALLLAVSPIHVWHSQDTRMYSLLFALAVLSSYLLLRALSRPRPLAWLAYGVAVAAAVYTQNTVVFTVAAQMAFAGLFILNGRRWSLLPGVGLSLAVMAALYLPWLPTAASQATHLRQYFWIGSPTARTVLDTFDYVSSAFLFRDSPWYSNFDVWPGSMIYLVFLALLLLGASLMVRRRSSRLYVLNLVALLVVPIAGEFVVSFVRPIYLNRTLLAVAAPLLILYAAAPALARGRWRWVAVALFLAALACNAASLSNMYRNAGKEDWRGAAALVAEQGKAGDVLFFDLGLIQVPFDYYYRRSGVPLDEYGYPQEYTFWELQETMNEGDWWAVVYNSSDSEAAISRFTSIAQEHERVWLVLNRPLSGGRLEERLAQQSTRVESYNFFWITVRRYDLRGTE